QSLIPQFVSDFQISPSTPRPPANLTKASPDPSLLFLLLVGSEGSGLASSESGGGAGTSARPSSPASFSTMSVFEVVPPTVPSSRPWCRTDWRTELWITSFLVKQRPFVFDRACRC